MNRITKEQVIERVKKDGRDLRKVFKEFRNDKDVVITAVKENNIAFHWASDELKNDEEFIKELCENSDIFKFFYDLKIEIKDFFKKEKYVEENEFISKINSSIFEKASFFSSTYMGEDIENAKIEFLGKSFFGISDFVNNFVNKEILYIKNNFFTYSGECHLNEKDSHFKFYGFVTDRKYNDFYDFLVDNNFSKDDILNERIRIFEEEPEYYVTKFFSEVTEDEWIDCLVYDFKIYRKLPKNLKENKEFILKFLECFSNNMEGIFATFNNQNIKAKILRKVKSRSVAKIIPEKFKDDKEFIKECVKKYGFLYVTLPKDLQDDQSIREIVINDEYYKDYIN